jgi:hypothetical protein
MKKSLAKKSEAVGKPGSNQATAHDSSLLIFKLFADLELADADRVNKVYFYFIQSKSIFKSIFN